MNAANPAQNIMAKTITIKDIGLQNTTQRRVSIARQFYVEFSVGDTMRLTDSARETESRTSWEKPLYFDGDDRSVLLVQVYRKHRVRKPELVGCHSDTISEVVRKLKDGVLEATLRKDTPDGPVLSGITIKFALAAKPCGEANAEEDEVTDPAKMVNTTMHETMLEALSRRMEVFMRISISNAEIYPYASTAWSAISIASKVFVGRKNRDDRIIRLVALMCTVFVSVENVEPLKGTGPYMETLALLLQQVAECGDFITEYAKSKHRISDVDSLNIRDYETKFRELEVAFLERVRVARQVAKTIDLQTVNLQIRDLNDIPYAFGARYAQEKGCLPGTRESLLREICEILTDLNEGPQVCLLTGVAGSGKSTVAHSIARLYDSQKRLGSSYFFAKNNTAGRNPKNLLSTIARDLADHHPDYRTILWGVVKDNRALRRSTSPFEQLEKLIVEPSQHLHFFGPLVIVIDALDESSDQAGRHQLLQALSKQIASNSLPTHLRFLITARPESDILTALPPGPQIIHKQLNDISQDIIDKDPTAILEHGGQCISPSSTEAAIRRIVQWTIRQLPRVLINTSTGRLYNRSEQTSAFESLPIFNELVLSMKTHIDYVRIKHEVRYYFRYVMLSHKWEENEPLFQQVIHIAVYDLDKSPTHDKLRAFCEIVRNAGFNWAWSDTCCIDKSDHFVLQEALVAMFKWYQGSAIAIVFLRGVRSSSQLGALVRSIWNTRTWTLQEYIAAKVIHFYTEDWTPYLNLELLNHKESPEVISEMEEATGVSADQLMSLRPGLTSIREKLRLASTRQTTLVEDAAYSLLGIFSVTGLPAIYGEGEDSLGRLLAHVLTGSGDASILAWTGESGSFNSCLPANITVFDGPASSHLPPPLPDAEMENFLAASHTPSFDIDVALTLYDRLNELPAPWFAASRMKLPCIAFQLPPLSPYRTRSGHVYRADTLTFGMVKIKTRYDLTRMHSLYLVHPWLDTLLEHEGKSGGIVDEDVAPPPSPSMDGEESLSNEIGEQEMPVEENDDSLSLPGCEPQPSPAPVRLVQMDRETRARRFVAHLRQPFGAVLLTLASAGGRAVDYRRVAADSLVTVQFQENVLLSDILDNVRTLDVL